MATPPTFVSFGASVFNTTTTPKTVAVTLATGDRVLVASVAANTANGAVNTAPTGGGETYSQLATLGADSTDARAIAWSMTASSSQSFSISCVRPLVSSTIIWGCMVWIWRDSDGFGVVGAPTVGSTSNSVTATTQAANSAFCVVSSDWNAVDGTTRTRRTINSSTGTEDTYFRDSAEYTLYAQRYADCGAAGSITGGYSAPTGQASAIIGAEIKGTTGGGGPVSPSGILLPPFRRRSRW